jgi:hypothetical protein
MKPRIRAGRRLQLAVIGALGLALSMNIQGCTVIGFAIGANADSKNGTGGPALLFNVNVGSPVTLLLWDGSTVKGRFAGWSRDSAVALASTDVISPRGAVVRLATDSGEVRIPAEGIAKVSVRVWKGRIGGLVFGLAADAIVISTLRPKSHPVGEGCEGPPPGTFYAKTAPGSNAADQAAPTPAPATRPTTSAP